MDIFDLLTMFGGLALFLYGMDVMGDGLKKAAGSKMESILAALTSNRFKGFLLGAFVTAIIQSSSATTVMVVGFVNSGIMKLTNACGVIMGANMGTTITSWILSLTGISGENVFLRLLKPSSFVPVLAIIGIFLLTFKENERRKDIATILLGFSVLMFGMETMSSSVAPLADDPNFTGILLKFSNPFLGFMAGLILTVVIQSSSASIGILQALSITGVVPYAVAIPIIMGQNLGTCVTALIASIGAKPNARRAALIHLYYNIIGVSLFMIGFYSINAFADFAFMSHMSNPAGIALVHSLFNVGEIIVIFPMGNLLVKMAMWTVKDEPVEEAAGVDTALGLLDDRFLATPAVAVSQAKSVADDMADKTRECLIGALDLVSNYSKKTFKNVIDLEGLLDKYEDEINTYLVKISARQISKSEGEMVSLLYHTAGNLERMSDHARNIAESARGMNDKGLEFSDKAKKDMETYIAAVKENVNTTVESFINKDIEMAKRVEPLEEVIDNINEKARKNHLKRLRKGKCTNELGLELEDLMTDFERISDHCSNIAVTLLELSNDTYETHEYLDQLRVAQSPEFRMLYEDFSEKYKL